MACNKQKKTKKCEGRRSCHAWDCVAISSCLTFHLPDLGKALLPKFLLGLVWHFSVIKTLPKSKLWNTFQTVSFPLAHNLQTYTRQHCSFYLPAAWEVCRSLKNQACSPQTTEVTQRIGKWFVQTQTGCCLFSEIFYYDKYIKQWWNASCTAKFEQTWGLRNH